MGGWGFDKRMSKPYDHKSGCRDVQGAKIRYEGVHMSIFSLPGGLAMDGGANLGQGVFAVILLGRLVDVV